MSTYLGSNLLPAHSVSMVGPSLVVNCSRRAVGAGGRQIRGKYSPSTTKLGSNISSRLRQAKGVISFASTDGWPRIRLLWSFGLKGISCISVASFFFCLGCDLPGRLSVSPSADCDCDLLTPYKLLVQPDPASLQGPASLSSDGSPPLPIAK